MICAATIRKLELKDGDVLALPADIDPDQARDIGHALLDHIKTMHTAPRILIIQGDVQVLDERSMNAAGWYRK